MVSRKSSRRSSRRHGGKRSRRNVMTRKNRGVFSALYSPVSGVLSTANNVVRSGLDTVVDVPSVFVRGAKNTVSGSLHRLVRGVNNIGHKATSGVDRAISGAFSRKNRKNSRKNRKASRKAERKNRKASRKAERKASRKAERKARKASRKARKH